MPATTLKAIIAEGKERETERVETALTELISRAEALEGRPLPVVKEAVAPVLAMADGDGRYLLNIVEQLYALAGPTSVLNLAQVTAGLQKRAHAYDKAGDGHYNLISALHKAVRGSDPDAALYWFARMIDGGEDPLYLARRLVRMASEDIGLADPTALMVTSEAARAYERMGSPEGDLALAHAVIHLATAPKSNAAYVAWKAALQSARDTGSLMPPKHILNAPTKMMKDQGYGAGYAYDHDTEEGVSGQNYFPDGMERQSFYQPKGEGREKSIAERLAWIAKLRDRKGGA